MYISRDLNLLGAATAETVIEAALGYLAVDVSVVACIGKRASVDWSRWQVVRPTFGLIHFWELKGWLRNVAIVCGQVSQGLVVIDLDGTDAVHEYEKKFHHLLRTFNVISGSGKGKHYYYRVSAPTPTTRTKGFELRSDGCYVIAPPSIHPDTGNRYRVERYSLVMDRQNMDDVRDWILSKAPAKPENDKRMPSMDKVRQATAYASKALENECSNVQQASNGDRNRRLFLAALKLGNLIALNHISQSEVENALMRAASDLSSTDGEGQSWRTIQSGIERGIRANQRRE